MSRFNVRDFGAVGDGSQNDFPAFQKALDAIHAEAEAADPTDNFRGAILFVPSGIYRLDQSLKINRSIVLQGEGPFSSVLHFRAPVNAPLAGIIVDRLIAQNETLSPDRTLIRGLGIRRVDHNGNQVIFRPGVLPHSAPILPSPPVDDDDNLLNGTSSGIVLYYRAMVEHCLVAGFAHDGIHINAPAHSGRNCDNWQVRDCYVLSNGRHGLFVSGHDANTGCALNLQCQVNRAWGFYDKSDIGNTYVSCIADLNGHIQSDADPRLSFGGAYRTTQKSAKHVLVACYAEAGDRIRIIAPTMLLGGSQPGELIVDPETTNNAVIINSNTGSAEFDTVRSHGPIATSIAPKRPNAAASEQPIFHNEGMVLVNAELGPRYIRSGALDSAAAEGSTYARPPIYDQEDRSSEVSWLPRRRPRYDFGGSGRQAGEDRRRNFHQTR